MLCKLMLLLIWVLQNISVNTESSTGQHLHYSILISAQQQIRRCRRTDQWTGRQGSRNHQNRTAKIKRIFKNEDSLRDFLDNIKCINIWIIGMPEGKERDKGTEHLFEEIMAENFPNLVKITDVQAQEAQRVPHKMNTKTPRLRGVVIKTSKVKEIILKAVK